jgi:menaquinone-9 beta-reductase
VDEIVILPATITASDAAKSDWDVAVIGAGPAGSMAAQLLSRRGLRTLLIDRAQFPRWKVCGGCLNQNALAALAAAGMSELPARLGAVPLQSIQLCSNGRSANLRWPGGVSLSREALDAEMIREAIRAGAAFLPGTRATMGEIAGEYRAVELEANVIRARVVLVADGLNGQVAGDAIEGSLIGAGTMLDDVPAWCEPGTVAMATAPGGYVGAVIVEGGRLDVAAAFDAAFVRSRGGLGEAAMDVLRSAGLPDFEPIRNADWKGTPALTRSSRRIAGPRWFAIGDAAGYVEPFTGEGIGWALASAFAVAPLAAQPWNDGHVERWSREHRRIVKRRQVACRAIAWALRRPALCSAAVRVLRFAPRLASPVVGVLHRTEFDPEGHG